MESYVAIFLSIGTFIFTYYQWITTMNSRRPRLTIAALRSEKMYYSNYLNFFRLYLPTKWHIVNLADIPNSIMGIKIYVKARGKWVAGEFHNPDFHKNTTINDQLPVSITGHQHHSFTDQAIYTGKTCYYQFSCCPTTKELRSPQVKVELEDQYGNFHEQILTSKDVRTEKLLEFPDQERILESKESQILLSIQTTEKEKPVEIRAIYNAKTNSKDYPHLTIYKFNSWSGYWGDYFYISKDESSHWQGKQEEKIQVDSWQSENIKVYTYQENNIPKVIEVDANGKISKVDIPQDLISSLENS